MDRAGIDLPPTDSEGLSQPPPIVRIKYPKWPFVLAALMLVLGLGVVLARNVEVGYYALQPGPVNDVDDFVEVAAGDGNEDGDLFFLTVSLRETNLLEAIIGWFDPTTDLQERETIRPVGVTQEQLRRQNLDMMEGSKANATKVALEYLGYEVEFDARGAEVIAVLEGSGAEGVLTEGDIIIDAAESTISTSADLIGVVGDRAIGDSLNLTVLRPGEGGTDEEVDLTVVLGPNPDDEERPLIGILVGNAGTFVFPVDVEIDSRNIGGPSAGLMFTLQIIDELTPEELTSGYRIAGTGSIDSEGNVGAIGGVRQKVFGAIEQGVDHVLVPSANYEDAVDAAGDDVGVVSVDTLQDALDFLESLVPVTS
ncbi:MAG: PDZ domain-containing protein [Acidimicrobiia bacterium]|nr:PDZ domain-containing protein [Acidimicrobiia bacterium]